MEEIKNTILQVMQRLDTKRKTLDKDKPDAILKHIFSGKELKHVRLDYLKKGVLSLSVDSSSWLYYFSLHKEAVLKKLRGKSKAAIKDIRFYLGEIR
jgi:hypothetical protein